MMQPNYWVKCRHDITINQTVVLQFSKWQSMKIIISTLYFQLPYISQLSSDIWRGWMYPLLSWRTPNLTHLFWLFPSLSVKMADTGNMCILCFVYRPGKFIQCSYCKGFFILSVLISLLRSWLKVSKHKLLGGAMVVYQHKKLFTQSLFSN